MAFDMYQAHVLDHAKHPRHFGALQPADASAHLANPLCGDAFDFSVRVHAGAVADVGFTGDGCAISKAAASMVAEYSLHKPVAELQRLTLADVVRLLGVPVNPARLKCASLGLETLQQALHEVV